MKIIGIGGSLRDESYAYIVLNHALNRAKQAGWDIELIDLRELQLPFCHGGEDYRQYPDVGILRKAVQSAHGIILVSPEYHGSVSGILKNALDLLEEGDIKGKVVATVGILGGAFGHGVTNTLGHICRHLHAWVVPLDLLIPNAGKAFNEKGELIDIVLCKRMDELVDLLLDGARKLGNA